MTFSRSALLFAFAVSVAAPASAQDWRGTGRVGGKVIDDSGKPIAGVVVRARMPESGNRGPGESRSNDKGEWAVGGIGSGKWDLDFEKDGYETFRTSLAVSEVNRGRPMEVVLKKKVVAADPNAAIKASLIEAADLMNAKKFAEARAIYEKLAAEHPGVKQFTPLIARAYYGEGQRDKAIDVLRGASAADPDNLEVKVLLGALLSEAGKAEEARTILASVDDSKIQDPVILLNLGIGMINEGKHAEAIPWITRAITRFPDYADSYYYRGLAYVATAKIAEAKVDLDKFIAMAKPDAPELEPAKKLLASISK